MTLAYSQGCQGAVQVADMLRNKSGAAPQVEADNGSNVTQNRR